MSRVNAIFVIDFEAGMIVVGTWNENLLVKKWMRTKFRKSFKSLRIQTAALTSGYLKLNSQYNYHALP